MSVSWDRVAAEYAAQLQEGLPVDAMEWETMAGESRHRALVQFRNQVEEGVRTLKWIRNLQNMTATSPTSGTCGPTCVGGEPYVGPEDVERAARAMHLVMYEGQDESNPIWDGPGMTETARQHYRDAAYAAILSYIKRGGG